MLCAIATDDGTQLMDRHFGDAVQYDIYQLTGTGVLLVKTIVNPFRDDGPDEHGSAVNHADRLKAGNMKELFLADDVRVLVSRRFGPNIQRMVKNFVPVVARCRTVAQVRDLLRAHRQQITRAWDAGSGREPVIIS